ncbi:hypothetical protein, partial [Methylobacterium radiotolerans]|uniref:hypothetical protein n=1 Tax=Methylobacterium radiotolerans TaxID=31998 RepID=UPI001AEC977D
MFFVEDEGLVEYVCNELLLMVCEEFAGLEGEFFSFESAVVCGFSFLLNSGDFNTLANDEGLLRT